MLVSRDDTKSLFRPGPEAPLVVMVLLMVAYGPGVGPNGVVCACLARVFGREEGWWGGVWCGTEDLLAEVIDLAFAAVEVVYGYGDGGHV